MFIGDFSPFFFRIRIIYGSRKGTKSHEVLDILVSVAEIVGNNCCWMACVKLRRDLEISVFAIEYQNLWVFLFNYLDKSLNRSILSW